MGDEEFVQYAKPPVLISPEMFRHVESFFEAEEPYTWPHGSRWGFSAAQIAEINNFTMKQATLIASIMNRWIDAIPTLRILDSDKKRLVSCTYRFGKKPSARYACRLRALCPWCRSSLITRIRRRIGDTSGRGLTLKTGTIQQGNRKSVMRPPRGTLYTVRSIALHEGELTGFGAFILESGEWTSKRSLTRILDDALRLNLDLVLRSPDNTFNQYMSLMSRLRTFSGRLVGNDTDV